MVFFEQINTLLEWKTISALIDKYYKKGKSTVGKTSGYHGSICAADYGRLVPVFMVQFVPL
ncbi:MAG: hypothetical protein JKY08_10045 [Flavobacteriaceae bacterium]|nr:hypothetical protein [Flavobacteriaceae bacterium]